MRKLQVPEEGHITEFVMAHCSPSWEQEAMLAGNGSADTGLDGPCLNNGFTGDNPIDHQLEPFPSNGYETESNTKSWVPPTNDNSSLPRDLSVDQIRLCNSSLNFFVASLPPTDDRPKNDIFLEGSLDSIHKPHSFSYSAMDAGFPDTSALQQSIGIVTPNLHPSLAESSVTQELGQDKDSIKQDMGQSNSISDCSDQMEEDDGHKAVGRSGRLHQSKHFVAERKRRAKLNERLYLLRSLVPKISRMDKASILGDAIEFVKELQKQVKDLQDELEETQVGGEQKENCNNNDNVQLEVPNQNVASHGDRESPNGLKTGMADQETRCSSSNKTGDFVKHNHDLISTDKALQMEVQVEVSQVDGNELFLKVFWEQKPARFVRLMEAINSLGLEVTNVNVTTFRGLVLNVFKVKKRENEVVEADQARDSLLELIRNPNGGRPESGCIRENGGSDYDHHHHS